MKRRKLVLKVEFSFLKCWDFFADKDRESCRTYSQLYDKFHRFTKK